MYILKIEGQGPYQLSLKEAGPQGEKGEKGEKGDTGAKANITISASMPENPAYGDIWIYTSI